MKTETLQQQSLPPPPFKMPNINSISNTMTPNELISIQENQHNTTTSSVVSPDFVSSGNSSTYDTEEFTAENAELEMTEREIIGEEESMLLINPDEPATKVVDEQELPHPGGLSVVSSSSIPLGRPRFFSIDVDGELEAMSCSFLASQSSHNPLSTSLSASHTSAFSIPPPAIPCSTRCSIEEGNYETNEDAQNVVSSTGISETYGHGQRDRGLSLDLLAFGIHDEDLNVSSHAEPSSAVERTQSDSICSEAKVLSEMRIRVDKEVRQSRSDSFGSFFGLTERRPRGDSIIYDPTSFQIGGIHEETAKSVGRDRGLSFLSVCGSTAATDEYESIVNDAVKENDILLDDNEMIATTRQSDIATVPITANNSTALTQFENQIPFTSDSSTGSNPSLMISSEQTLELLNKGGRIGIYLPDERKQRIAKFHRKRQKRIWKKRIKYDCRKKLADSRPRIKGRFVKRGDIVDGI